MKRLAANIIEETDKYKGEIISVTKSTVSADGKAMTSVVSNELVGATEEFVAVKQQACSRCYPLTLSLPTCFDDMGMFARHN